MSYLPLHSLRTPQKHTDNASILKPAQGYNNLMKDFYHAPDIPNVFPTVPRAVMMANQNYIGRSMLMPESQTYDRAYQPKLKNMAIPLDEVSLRNVGGIQRPMFSVY